MAKKMGRPLKPIDFEELDKLLYFQCSEEECAWWFEVAIDTLARAIKREKKMTFKEYSDQKKSRGKIALKRRLFQSAKDGNVASLIFALKNYCGLVDAYQTKNETEVKNNLTFKIGFDDEPDPDPES